MSDDDRLTQKARDLQHVMEQSCSVCSSRPQPPNLDMIERRMYDEEIAQNPGLRQHSGSRRNPRSAGRNR